MTSDEWNEYFMRIARAVAEGSTDTTKVGCVIVAGHKGEILSTGFNGLPRGVAERPERLQRPAKYLWTSHAEENAVAFAARRGHSLEGATAYVTHLPCSRCARSLIQAGVSCVMVGAGTTSMPGDEFLAARDMMHEARVRLLWV